MGTERQIKGSLDISLHQIFMNFRLIPSIGGLAELFLVACKVGTVIWTDILNLAPPCYESSQRQQEEIGVQTERDFDVHHANNQASKDNSIYLTRLRPSRTRKGRYQLLWDWDRTLLTAELALTIKNLSRRWLSSNCRPEWSVIAWLSA